MTEYSGTEAVTAWVQLSCFVSWMFHECFLIAPSEQLIIKCNLCFVTRLLASPVLIIFEGLCLELSAGGRARCFWWLDATSAQSEWQAVFSYRQKRISWLFLNLQLPDAPPLAYSSYRTVQRNWVKVHICEQKPLNNKIYKIYTCYLARLYF